MRAVFGDCLALQALCREDKGGIMAKKINLNFGWKFSEHFSEEYLAKECDDAAFETVDIPHTCKLLPYNDFDEAVYQFESVYRKYIDIPEEYRGKALILSFEAVASYAEVYVNGKKAFSHKGGYTEFHGDISSLVNYGETNVIAVMADSREREEIPPFGRVVDYLVYGGIYREVYLYVHDGAYAENMLLTPVDVLKSPKLQVKLIFDRDVKNMPVSVSVTSREGEEVANGEFVADGRQGEITLDCKNVKLWDVEDPVLYTVTARFANEVIQDRTGFRECRFTHKGFYLNGRRLKIRGLNRHQSYPYVGYAMPASAQKADARYLKDRLQVNLVRTSHYPDSRHFLDECDERGLMVFTEIPGWQYVGKSEEWRGLCLQHVREMILQDYNHPSVILWGVRINESLDDDELYAKTNKLAHELDKSRQTGGVRCIPHSRLLEDVYTYNDFVHSGGKLRLLPKYLVTGRVPYLVTEHNGHMFPTKTFDHEKKRQEHALRHARVMDRMYAANGTSGSIGWCMSDYNTHKDFGSGDRICYHGVSDMFRIDKLAAKVYSMQGDVNKSPVLELSSNMEIGDVAGGQVGTVYMFTNCPVVKMYKNGVHINTFDMKEQWKASKEFRHLPVPPVKLVDTIGNQLERDDEYKFSKKDAEKLRQTLLTVKKFGAAGAIFFHPLTLIKCLFRYRLPIGGVMRLYGKYVTSWGGKQVTYRFEGLNDKGEVVAVTEKGSVSKASMYAKADSNTLCEDETYDVTRIEIKAVSQCGNVLPYDDSVVKISVDGPVSVIGDSEIVLLGGQRAVWIRTVGKSGKAVVTLSSTKLGERRLEFDVIKK